MTARKLSAEIVQWEDAVQEVPLDVAARPTDQANRQALGLCVLLSALGTDSAINPCRESATRLVDLHDILLHPLQGREVLRRIAG